MMTQETPDPTVVLANVRRLVSTHSAWSCGLKFILPATAENKLSILIELPSRRSDVQLAIDGAHEVPVGPLETRHVYSLFFSNRLRMKENAVVRNVATNVKWLLEGHPEEACKMNVIIPATAEEMLSIRIELPAGDISLDKIIEEFGDRLPVGDVSMAFVSFLLFVTVEEDPQSQD
jgi:hypothetical protein